MSVTVTHTFRYRLHVYVGAGGLVIPSPPAIGDLWVPFHVIYTRRPWMCRFGIGENEVGPPTRRFVLWDFFDDDHDHHERSSWERGWDAADASDNYDGLLMKAIHLHDLGDTP